MLRKFFASAYVLLGVALIIAGIAAAAGIVADKELVSSAVCVLVSTLGLMLLFCLPTVLIIGGKLDIAFAHLSKCRLLCVALPLTLGVVTLVCFLLGGGWRSDFYLSLASLFGALFGFQSCCGLVLWPATERVNLPLPAKEIDVFTAAVALDCVGGVFFAAFVEMISTGSTRLDNYHVFVPSCIFIGMQATCLAIRAHCVERSTAIPNGNES